MTLARTSSRFVLAAIVTTLASCTNEYDILPEPVEVDPGEITECEFTPVSGTRISVYDCNPVFVSPGDDPNVQVDSVGFHTTEVLGHPFYQIWYATTPGTGYGLGYAVSGDGTNWETHPDNPLLNSTPGAWDQDSMDAITVVWDEIGQQYVLTYQGVTLPTGPLDPGRWGMGLATSPDGVSWSQHPSNPVIDFNEMIDQSGQPYLSPCWPLTLTTGTYGFTGYLAASYVYDPFFGGSTGCDVYTATAGALDAWTIGAQPVLSTGAWYDMAGIAGAAIVPFGNTQYMFYVSFEEWVQQSGYQTSRHHHLAMATSTDGGATWQKNPINPLPVSLTEEGYVSAVGAQLVGDRIHFWVTDYYEDIEQQAVGYYLFEPNIDPHP